MLPALRPALLLVDDDPTLLSVLARRLTREGFDVRTAGSGQAALAALERSWPALVVVDVMMPGMDGFELCRRIKRIADLPIIVLSAVDAGEAKVLALPTEVRVLQVLIGALDRTVPTETLLERVWSEADGADPSYVWVTVRRLRRKVEVDPDHPRYLLTERGIGYRLTSSTIMGTDVEAGSA